MFSEKKSRKSQIKKYLAYCVHTLSYHIISVREIINLKHYLGTTIALNSFEVEISSFFLLLARIVGPCKLEFASIKFSFVSLKKLQIAGFSTSLEL